MATLPIYMRIRQYVVDLIFEHSDGDVRVMSERELCKKFSVTRPTARQALKELIDEGYLYVKPGRGMFINSKQMLNHTLALHKSFKVMVIFGAGRFTDLDGFYMDILARICDRLKNLPVRLRMANLNQVDYDMALEELEMYNPDGIIWVRPDSKCMDLIAALRQKIPVYAIANIADDSKCHVTMDYHQAGRMTAAWFLDQKRKDILFIGASQEHSVKSAIYKGWEDEFYARNVPYDKNLQIDMNCNIINKTKELYVNNSIDGIFTFASEFAAVDLALTELGSNIKDCPIMLDENHYGLYNTQIEPSAKLIISPPEIAEQAADNLFKSLNDPNYNPDEIILQAKIINTITQKENEK